VTMIDVVRGSIFSLSFFVSMSSHAAVYGTAILTGCAPAGGFEASCSVWKTSSADPQNTHTLHCEINISSQAVASYDGPIHYNVSGTETHHSPDIQAPFQEQVYVCALNDSKWWVIPPEGDAYGLVSAYDFCCRQTRGG